MILCFVLGFLENSFWNRDLLVKVLELKWFVRVVQFLGKGNNNFINQLLNISGFQGKGEILVSGCFWLKVIFKEGIR